MYYRYLIPTENNENNLLFSLGFFTVFVFCVFFHLICYNYLNKNKLHIIIIINFLILILIIIIIKNI